MDEKKVREEEYLEFPWGIEDTIENLRELKSILQKQVREKDCDGKGTQDAFELGFDFDRAIEALEKRLPKKPKHIHENYGKYLWKKNADGSVDMKAFDGGIHGYAAECERCGSLAFYEELLEGEDCEVDEYFCPSCNCQVPKGENACKCGQRIDW